MENDPEEIHSRYLVQTGWTKPFRQYLYGKMDFKHPVKILEVGCGTGAAAQCIKEEMPFQIDSFMISDIDGNVLKFAHRNFSAGAVQCSGYQLPFQDSFFDFVYCHYRLLWTAFPSAILNEMYRVLRRDGFCAAVAEPDYSEMTAEPEELLDLAHKQERILSQRGADTKTGRKLGDLFNGAGFRKCESGRYRSGGNDWKYIEQEISQMLRDCRGEKFYIDKKKEYVYNIPTYYAYGMK